jgi:hypothetical protein
MAGFAFEDESFFVFKDAEAEVQPRAVGESGPEFHGQDIIVAGRGFVAEMAFDDRKKRVLRLQFEERNAELPEAFAAGGFEDIEVARVIYMVAEGAIGVHHAISMAKTSGHGGNCKFQIPNSKFQTPETGIKALKEGL